MQGRSVLLVALIFYLSSVIPSTQSHDEETFTHFGKEKVTHLHFYLNDILSGKNPSAVLVAQPNNTDFSSSPTPFGTVYVVDDPLTDGPDPISKVIGNAQGLYISSGQGTLSLVLAMDFGFTAGKYNGSSISVFSRNPVMEGDNRELSVVGGRGKFRLARGFALVNTYYLNVTNGDAILEYNVTLLHY